MLAENESPGEESQLWAHMSQPGCREHWREGHESWQPLQPHPLFPVQPWTYFIHQIISHPMSQEHRNTEAMVPPESTGLLGWRIASRPMKQLKQRLEGLETQYWCRACPGNTGLGRTGGGTQKTLPTSLGLFQRTVENHKRYLGLTDKIQGVQFNMNFR